MKQSKTTQWINKHYQSNLKDSDYNHVKDFLLLWNLLENDIFANNFAIPTAELKIDSFIIAGRISEIEINKLFGYFQNKYTEDGIRMSGLFNNLMFRGRDRMEFVENMLLSNNSTLNEKTLAIMIIVWRYRNNLFHGLKDITRINYQKNNFLRANKFLMLMLEANILGQLDTE